LRSRSHCLYRLHLSAPPRLYGAANTKSWPVRAHGSQPWPHDSRRPSHRSSNKRAKTTNFGPDYCLVHTTQPDSSCAVLVLSTTTMAYSSRKQIHECHWSIWAQDEDHLSGTLLSPGELVLTLQHTPVSLAHFRLQSSQICSSGCAQGKKQTPYIRLDQQFVTAPRTYSLEEPYQVHRPERHFFSSDNPPDSICPESNANHKLRVLRMYP
jgi:hypothetical protein